MPYRLQLAVPTACLAAVTLTACGGGDDEAASSTAPSTVSATSSAATTRSSTSQPISTTGSSKPTTSTTTTVTRTVAPSTTAKPTTTAAAPAKKKGCFASDGKELFLEGVSCGLAQNAYDVYKRGYVPNETGQYQAYSAAKHKMYTFNCMSNDQNVTNCGGGDFTPGSLFGWQN